MVPTRVYSWSLVFLIVAGLGLGATTASTSAAPINFTGYVTQDFPSPSSVGSGTTIAPVSNNALNIGQSSWITNNGWISGWSVKDVYLNYDKGTDTLYVGVDTFANSKGQYAPFGQANGDPSGTPTPYDPAHLGGDKSFALTIAPVNPSNVNQVGTPVVIAGVPADKTTAGTGTDGFTVSQFNAANASSGLAYQFGQQLSQFTGNLAFDPSPSHPQLEFTIKDFSKIPGIYPSNGIWFSAYAGSSLDGVAGEAYLSAYRSPDLAPQTFPSRRPGWPGSCWLAPRPAVSERGHGNRVVDETGFFQPLCIDASLRKAVSRSKAAAFVHRPVPTQFSSPFPRSCLGAVATSSRPL